MSYKFMKISVEVMLHGTIVMNNGMEERVILGMNITL